MTETLHDFLQKTFTYDEARGRLVRRFKSSRGPGRAGEDLKPVLNPTTGLYAARVSGKVINYARAVWLWHHPSCRGFVRAKDHDFRIENLALYGPNDYRGEPFILEAQ